MAFPTAVSCGTRAAATPPSGSGARSSLAQKLNDRGQISGAYNNPNPAAGPPTATAPPMAPMG